MKSITRKALCGVLAILLVTGLCTAFAAAPVSQPDIPANLVQIPANPDFSFKKSLTGGAIGGPGGPGGDMPNPADMTQEELDAMMASMPQSDPGEASPIDHDYYLSRYLTTNADYKAFVDATGYENIPSYWTDGNYPEGKADHPVLYVSALDAEAYCDWLDSLYPDWDFRLPTEAEHENAARGPEDWAYPWGDDFGFSYDASTGAYMCNCSYGGYVLVHVYETYGPDPDVTFVNQDSPRYGETLKLSEVVTMHSDGSVWGWAEHTDNTGFINTDIFRQDINTNGGFTTAVGSFEGGKSYYGLYDMGGDAYEWTSSTIIAQNGREAGTEVRAVRGGSWYAMSGSCTSTQRGEGRDPSGGYNTIGFRVAADRRDTQTAPISAQEPAVPAQAGTVTISDQALLTDGKPAEGIAYNIDGYNYFKLRDLACLLRGTAAAFQVEYDGAANRVLITTGGAYTPVGDELTPANAPEAAGPSTQVIFINGTAAQLDAYNIDGYNYFQLRDLGDALGFQVEYDETSGSAVLSTDVT